MMTNDDADANANASDDGSGVSALSSEAQAFVLVIAAGLCTSVGAAVVFFPRLANLANRTTLAISLGFASGVMLYVSLVQIYKKSVGGYVESGLDDQTSLRYATFTFFGGCIIMMILDKFVDWLLKCEDEGTTNNSNINDNHGSGGSSGTVDLTEVNNSSNNQAEITAAGAGRHHQHQHQHQQQQQQPYPNCSHNRQVQQHQHHHHHQHQHENHPLTTMTTRCDDGGDHEQDHELPAVAGIIDGLAKHPGDELDEIRRQFVEKVKQEQQQEKEKQEQQLKKQEEEEGGTSFGTTNTNTNTDSKDVDREEEDVEAGSVAVAVATGGAGAVVEDSSPDPAGSLETVKATATESSSTVVEATRLNNSNNDKPKEQQQPKTLRSMGFAMALAIGIHNFPEGMASYLAYQADPAVGIALAIGIAFHNIPEGLCVSMPLYYATSRRWYSFWWGALSGLTEPLGALFAWLVLKNGLDGTTNGVLFGIVAGMMTVISIQELLPNAHKYARNGSTVTYSFLSGAFIIALSIMLFPAE